MNEWTPWRCVGAAVIGTAHQRTNSACQDAFAYQELPNRALIMAVADGAGSAAKAGEGAHLLVQQLVEQLAATLTVTGPTQITSWANVMAGAFAATRAALVNHATAAQAPLRDYAATALVAVLTPHWTIGAALGDCALVVADALGNLISLCPPQRGEYANTTNFLTQADALAKLTITIMAAPVTGAALFSDGLLPLALNIAQNEPYRPFFNPLFAFVDHTDASAAPPQLATFLASPRVNARTDDDKTLVLARPVS